MAGHAEVASQLAAQKAQTKEALKGRERIPSLARMAELAGSQSTMPITRHSVGRRRTRHSHRRMAI